MENEKKKITKEIILEYHSGKKNNEFRVVKIFDDGYTKGELLTGGCQQSVGVELSWASSVYFQVHEV